jgi:hypothetical protein
MEGFVVVAMSPHHSGKDGVGFGTARNLESEPASNKFHLAFDDEASYLARFQ